MIKNNPIGLLLKVIQILKEIQYQVLIDYLPKINLYMLFEI